MDIPTFLWYADKVLSSIAILGFVSIMLGLFIQAHHVLGAYMVFGGMGAMLGSWCLMRFFNLWSTYENYKDHL